MLLLEGFPDEFNLNILRALREQLLGHDFGYGAGVLPHTRYFEMSPTSLYQELLDKYSGMGAAQDWPDGTPVPVDEPEKEWDFTIKQAGYGLGVKIGRHLIQYDRRRIVAQFISALADSMIQLQRTKHANVLNNAFAATPIYGDGQPLCDTDHPNAGGSNNRSNELATPAALSYTSIDTVDLLGANHVTFNGHSRPLMYNHLIVPTALRRLALTIVGSPLQPNTTDNAINPDVGMSGVTVESILSSTTAWFRQRVGSPADHGLLSLVGRPVQFRSYPEPSSESQVYYVATDFKETVEDWPGVAGTAGA